MSIQEIPVLPYGGRDGPHALSWQLGCSQAASCRARQLVREFLHRWDHDELTDDALLVTSELVTNAVIHAASPAGMTLSLRLVEAEADHCCVYVLVRDSGPRNAPVKPAVPDGQDSLPCTGRGLYLVDHLARAWGDITHRGGHVVWACLPCDVSTGQAA
ncbi:ATP-binding protein [Streptomyces sp. NPDC051133]|uniref:ATP-binding protein n=1 Tax=Streptomyces sp. NPDC051133 TaxID=3155521 RepID=UPI0034242880